MKRRTVFACQTCGAQQPRWVGRCPECGAFGTVAEERVEPASPGPSAAAPTTRPLGDHDVADAERVPTRLGEVDRVLGGGLVRGSVVLLAGEPGIGKSTIALQAALEVGRTGSVLLVCGEESPQQIRARAERIGAIPDGVRTLADPSVDAILAAVAADVPAVLVVDSIQTVHDPELASAPGSVTQVRECGARLARLARDTGTCVVLIGHVTKEGSVAGPRVLEHLVDVVLSFDGDRSGGVRVLRPLKNRFGSTHEAGFFEMATEGLVPIRDASRYLLADRTPGLAGSVLAAALEGRRPFVVEVQALVAETSVPVPRRTAIGLDGQRLPMITAVLGRRLKRATGGVDVFVSAVGGLRVAEPAADLPVALAMLSGWYDLPVPDDVVAFGEIGLAGEIRRVPAADRRLAEARAVGCMRAVVPHGVDVEGGGIDLVRVRDVAEAKRALERLSAELQPARGAGA